MAFAMNLMLTAAMVLMLSPGGFAADSDMAVHSGIMGTEVPGLEVGPCCAYLPNATTYAWELLCNTVSVWPFTL